MLGLMIYYDVGASVCVGGIYGVGAYSVKVRGGRGCALCMDVAVYLSTIYPSE